jgi:hypothetical protein
MESSSLAFAVTGEMGGFGWTGEDRGVWGRDGH